MTFQEKIHTLRVAGFCFDRLQSDINMQTTFMKGRGPYSHRSGGAGGHKGSSRASQSRGGSGTYGQAPVVVCIGRNT